MRVRSLLDLGVDLEKLKAKLLLKVEMPNGPDGCWLWKGHAGKRVTRRLSYGRIIVAGKQFYVHIAMYEVFKKKRIPKNLVLRHQCNTSLCCNPFNCLKPGSQKRNVKDAVDSGSHWSPRGDTHHSASINAETARLIRSLAAAGNTRLAIAFILGVSLGIISKVIRGLTWREA